MLGIQSPTLARFLLSAGIAGLIIPAVYWFHQHYKDRIWSTKLHQIYTWILVIIVLFLLSIGPNIWSERRPEKEALFPIKLQALLFAESVVADKASGTTMLKGVSHELIGDVFPGRANFFVYSRMTLSTSLKPNLEMRYRITDSDGNDIAASEWVDLSMGAGHPVGEYYHPFKGVLFKHPGYYYVNLELKRGKDVTVIAKEILKVVRKRLIGPKKEGSQKQ